MSWDNQTAGTMTSQYLLHTTCVFVLNQELSRKILQGMPSAAAGSSLTKGVQCKTFEVNLFGQKPSK